MNKKDAFKNWLHEKGYQKSTVQNYTSNINTIPKKASKTCNQHIDLYQVSNSEVNTVIDLIFTSENFKSLDKSCNNGYSAALNRFREFNLLQSTYNSNDNNFSQSTYNSNDINYFTIKISKKESFDIVKRLMNCEKNVEIDQLNQYYKKVKIDDIVFMLCSGDNVSWKKGLYGIAKIKTEPKKYDDKNFSIRIDMLYSFKEPIKRSEFIPYRNVYDAGDIGPATKGSQNQAIKEIKFDEAAAAIRGIIELRANDAKNILKVIPDKLANQAEKSMPIMKFINIPYRSINSVAGNNYLFYGIPGCGKSYQIKKMLEFDKDFQSQAKELGIESAVPDENIFRTTFFPDYTNADFVGQIMPFSKGDVVIYKPILGPFTRALKRAFETNEMIFLIIEEINRGNAPAIFGDLFQLLDRRKIHDNMYRAGDSEYFIMNDFIEEQIKLDRIFIPSNLTIIATMNTSDQNVFPLDTAFKRRWIMKHVFNDITKTSIGNKIVPGSNITWSNFVNTVNKRICKNNNSYSSEDKQIGPYFIDDSILLDSNGKYDDITICKNIERFCETIVRYIWEDIAKYEKDEWFKPITDVLPTYEDIWLNIQEKRNVLSSFRDDIFEDVINITSKDTDE